MSLGTVSVSYGCDGYDSAANTMTCTAAMAGQDTQTAVLSGSDVAFISATVVEGASLLSGGASASASASAAPKTSAVSASSGMQTSMASSTAATGSHASSHAASATSAGAGTPQATGAAARFGIEGAALLALAGAAAVNVF